MAVYSAAARCLSKDRILIPLLISLEMGSNLPAERSARMPLMRSSARVFKSKVLERGWEMRAGLGFRAMFQMSFSAMEGLFGSKAIREDGWEEPPTLRKEFTLARGYFRWGYLQGRA